MIPRCGCFVWHVALLGSSEPSSLCVLVAALDWTVAEAAVLLVVLGVFWLWTFSSTWSAVQLLVADEMRGRVMSLWVVVGLGCTAFGAALLGALAEVWTLPTTTWAITGVCAALVIWLVVKDRSR